MEKTINSVVLLGAKSTLAPLNSVPEELSRIRLLFKQCKIELEYEPYLTKVILSESLRTIRNKADIIHFAGHTDESTLQTDKELIHTNKIAEIIGTWNNKPMLVFLNGCNSSKQVSLLLNSGVKYVIATHNYIEDHSAASFAQEFYSELINDTTIEDAFSRAGSTVFLDKNKQSRTLSIPKKIDNNKWDWGLFTTKASSGQLYFPKKNISPRKFIKKMFVISALLATTYIISYYINYDKRIEVTLSPYQGYSFINPPLMDVININNSECISNRRNIIKKFLTNCTIVEIGDELVHKVEVCLEKKFRISSRNPYEIIEKIVNSSRCLKLRNLNAESKILDIDKSIVTISTQSVRCKCN